MCIWEWWRECSHLSTLAVAGVASESSLEGICTHHDGDARADVGEWFVFISPRCLLFVRDILLAMLI